MINPLIGPGQAAPAHRLGGFGGYPTETSSISKTTVSPG